VVGGGDTALSDALYLARFASKIYLIHRRDAFRGSKALQTAIFTEPKIELVYDSVVTALLGKPLSTICVRNIKADTERYISIAALFVAVGVIPRTELVKEQVDCNDGGYIVADMRMRTSLPRVYAAGDVRNTPLRQVVTAAADGAVAATQALDELI
jgi:thioredoxin reductase (NADPH)